MKLSRNDYTQVYVWVDDQDENVTVSPHFDYEADAIQWYKNQQMAQNHSDNATPPESYK